MKPSHLRRDIKYRRTYIPTPERKREKKGKFRAPKIRITFSA